MISGIKDYINNKYAIGALLINGKWGAGKTWTMKALKREHSLSPWWKFWCWRKFRFVSLFGIKDVEQFKDALKSKYSPTWYSFHKIIGFIGIAALLSIFPNLGVLIGKWPNTSLYDDKSAYYELFGLKGSVIASAIALILFVFFYFFINKKIKKRKLFKKNVFVFDDLERCNLPMSTLLGLINELVEDGIKVIIIANEDEISNERIEEYKRFKEKIVLMTLAHSANIDQIFNEIIKRYEAKYKEFLATYKNIIIDSFKKYANENIRALINGLSMFEKIFQPLMDKALVHKEMILLNFLEVYYLTCQGHNVTDIYDNLPYGGLLARYTKTDDTKNDKESIIQLICSDKFFIRSLATWIKTGYFNRHAFDVELNRVIEEQKPKEQIEISSAEKILKGWNLEMIPDEELLDAFDEALLAAYDGKTNFDGYISLMSADARLKILKVDHKTIDWHLFDEGLLKYINNIEATGDFESPEVQRHSFITDENLNDHFNEGAKRVYKRIDNYNAAARKNRKALINALGSGDIAEADSLAQHKIFEEFDDDLCNAFINIYKNATLPYEKRDLLDCFRKVINSVISCGKQHSNITISSLDKLKEAIIKIETVDNSISQKIKSTFVSDIETLIEKVKQIQMQPKQAQDDCRPER